MSNVPSVGSQYLYYGAFGTVFAFHLKDANLLSVNIHLGGAVKLWWVKFEPLRPPSTSRNKSSKSAYLKDLGSFHIHRWLWPSDTLKIHFCRVLFIYLKRVLLKYFQISRPMREIPSNTCNCTLEKNPLKVGNGCYLYEPSVSEFRWYLKNSPPLEVIKFCKT